MNKIYQQVFLFGLNVSYVLYFMVILGVGSLSPQYLTDLRQYLKVYIGILLVVLYNPLTYKEKMFTDFDRKLVFSSGVFLLLSSTLVSGIELYVNEHSKNIISFSAFDF